MIEGTSPKENSDLWEKRANQALEMMTYDGN